MTNETATLRFPQNRRVQFQISDVYFPERKKILEELHGKDLVQGDVIDVSEGREMGDVLVVQVEGLAQPVIVPLRCTGSPLKEPIWIFGARQIGSQSRRSPTVKRWLQPA
jgi:hypothetical protein